MAPPVYAGLTCLIVLIRFVLIVTGNVLYNYIVLIYNICPYF